MAPGLRKTALLETNTAFVLSNSQVDEAVMTPPENGPESKRHMSSSMKIAWPSRSPSGSGAALPTIEQGDVKVISCATALGGGAASATATIEMPKRFRRICVMAFMEGPPEFAESHSAAPCTP